MDWRNLEARDMQGNDILTANDVAAMVGFSCDRLYRLVANGQAPAPTRVGQRNYWTPAAISAWLDERARANADKDRAGQRGPRYKTGSEYNGTAVHRTA